MKRLLFNYLLSCLLLPYATNGFTLELPDDFTDSTEMLFDSEDILFFDLIADYDSILADRGEDPSYHNGRIVYNYEANPQIIVDCRIKTRGNFRKDPANCKFPPLLLNIKKKSAMNTLFQGQNRIKLVTHCQNERYVFEEYLIYKMYNLVTDLSFKVRLAQINYVHEKDGNQKILFTKYAVLIEEDISLAERFHAELIDIHKHQVQINRENMLKQALFQYMIGNKDWYVTTRHNVKLLDFGPDEGIFAVPYDFDFSGVILASYTIPPNIPKEMIEERRIYKGLCQTDEEVDLFREYYNELKISFSNLYIGNPYLSKGSSRRAVKYMDEFYKILNDHSLSKSIFQEVPNCLEPPPGLYD